MDSKVFSPFTKRKDPRNTKYSNSPILTRKGSKTLPPLTRNLQSLTGETKLSVGEVNYSIQQVDREIDFFLTQIDRELKVINEDKKTHQKNLSLDISRSSTPSDSIPKPGESKLHYRNGQSASKPTRAALLQKERTLLEQTSNFYSFLEKPDKFQESEQNKLSLVSQIQDNLHKIKEPCIEDIYFYVTKKAKLFSHYKQHGRFHSTNSHPTPDSKFSEAVLGEKSAPIPVLAHTRENSLVLNRYKMHDPVCLGLGQALETMSHIKILHLDQCGITDSGGAEILKGLKNQGSLTSFFYTSNEIGPKFATEFDPMLLANNLHEVNLRACKAVGASLLEVLGSLYKGKTLKKLYLSELGLNNLAIDKICKLLRRRNLIELDLSWNQIALEASKQFFTRLKRNRKLRNLDYSWNRLASNDSEISIIIGTAIMTHPSLMHLNLSYTKINDTDLAILARPLAESKTLIGVHFTGNNISKRMLENLKDTLGASEVNAFQAESASLCEFPIKLEQKEEELRPKQSFTKIMNLKLKDNSGRKVVSHRDNLVNIMHPSKNRDFYLSERHPERIFTRVLGAEEVKKADEWVLSEHCWICERWSFHQFEIDTRELSPVLPINALSFRKGEKSKLLLKASFNDWYEIEVEEKEENKYELSLLLPPGKHRLWFLLDNEDICVNKRQSRALWNGLEVNEIIVPIRVTEISLSAQEIQQAGPRRFNKEKSVFKAFLEDTDIMRKKMFDYDSRYFKFERMIRNKDHLTDLYDYLISQYAEIKEIFDNLAAVSNYPSIGWLDFSNFCEKTEILDNKNVNHAAIDRIFIAVNFEAESLDENPDRELCRYEFFEVLVRMGVCKYEGEGMTPKQATEKLLKDCVYKFAEFSKASRFRKEHLYFLEVNDLLEANVSIIETLFSRFKDRGGRWITIEGVKNLTKKTKIEISERDLLKCFAFSKMSILDEMNSGGAHNKMQFVEFLEFIGRLSDVVIQGSFPLHLKIEQVLQQMLVKNGLKFRLPQMPDEEEMKSDISD